jgi:Gpi18-like mannosyltransferase
MLTVTFGQTNFILLFFILLIIKNLDNWKSGVFFAFAVAIKPIAAVWCLYLILHKKWNAIISLTITGVLLIAASIVQIYPKPAQPVVFLQPFGGYCCENQGTAS